MPEMGTRREPDHPLTACRVACPGQLSQGGDRLHLHELIGVAEDSNAEQGARHVVSTEGPADHIPGSDQVAPVVAHDVDSRLDDVGQIGSGSTLGDPQVLDDQLRLPRHVAVVRGCTVFIQRAGASGEDKPRDFGCHSCVDMVGHIVGNGRTAGRSVRGNGDDALVGIGVLTQIGADLFDAAGALLSGTDHYAGAALLRQIVEVEYLTWAFAHQKRDPAVWLTSTHEDRRRLFTPAGLRNESAGHFLSADYGHHCEQGGHPVPRAIPLLGSSDLLHSQLLLVDLLLHGWRTSDNIAAWSKDRNADPLVKELRSVQDEFAEWGRVDPLYAWAVAQRPG